MRGRLGWRRVSGVRASVADEFCAAGCSTVPMFTRYLHSTIHLLQHTIYHKVYHIAWCIVGIAQNGIALVQHRREMLCCWYCTGIAQGINIALVQHTGSILHWYSTRDASQMDSQDLPYMQCSLAGLCSMISALLLLCSMLMHCAAVEEIIGVPRPALWSLGGVESHKFRNTQMWTNVQAQKYRCTNTDVQKQSQNYKKMIC